MGVRERLDQLETAAGTDAKAAHGRRMQAVMGLVLTDLPLLRLAREFVSIDRADPRFARVAARFNARFAEVRRERGER
jgi:hypothetical protein